MLFKRRGNVAEVGNLPLSRVQQAWLMLALVTVCLPIWFYLPIWVAAFCLVSICWRVRILWKGAAQPPLKVTAAIAVAAFITDFAQYRPPVGLEPMGALLLICTSLKVLEMRRIREARMVLYLCYFIASIQLIFEQAIWYFFISLFGILVTMSAQNMSEHDPWQQYSFTSFSLFPLKSMGWIALVSVPLTLVIFVFAPRLPSFWMIPVPQDQAKTGVSEVMTTGSIEKLTRSSKLAFRVSFDGAIPERPRLYWRALVLSDFDGQSWSNREKLPLIQDGGRSYWPGTSLSKPEWTESIIYKGQPLSYNVYHEPSGQPWLFSLTAPVVTEPGIGMTKGLRLISQTPVTQRTKYSVRSYLNYEMTEAILAPRDRHRNLHLPEDFNPRTRALAEQWLSAGLLPEQMVSRLFGVFNQQHTYTLEPGAYGTDTIDEFIFDRKRGFCEHFAQATVFLLRAAGIPARIVTGYQGGELHPDGDYLLVHQYDAHAWAEYWHQERGWVQVDPTAAVSPGRIEFGAREFFDEEPEFLADEVFSLNRMQDVQLLNWLRLRVDRLNYIWASWVLGYDNNKQLDFLDGLFGQLSYKKLLMYSALVFVFIISTIYWVLYLQSPERKRPAAEKLFHTFRNKLSEAGVQVEPGYTPQKLVDATQKSKPEWRDMTEYLAGLFEEHFYRNIDREQSIREALNNWASKSGRS